jgi:hypothetical protein
MIMHINTSGSESVARAPFGIAACSMVTRSFGAITPAAS